MSDTDPDEDELVNVMSNVLDRFAPETEPEAAPEALPDPVGAVATAMVQSVVEGRPELLATAVTRGAVVILVAPTGWMDAVAPAWRRIVLGQPEDPIDGDEYTARRKRERAAQEWPLGVGVDDVKQNYTGGSLARALRTGRGVLIAVNAIAVVDPGLRAAADLEVAIDPPTPEILAQVARELGDGAATVVEPEIAAAVQPSHLLGCLRPNQSAASYLARLQRVAAATLPAAGAVVARWTLDTLPLPPDVEAWARQVVADLADYRVGILSWADVDRGALLYGPPGCGKTTFAGALAASCGVPLIVGGYSVWESGPDGKSDYTKVIPRMRQSFAEAKRRAPCILFLDEIDSFIARGRAGHNESWWRPLVNALLAEVDGISGREGVVVIGATNLPDEIDPALRRSGRLDRELRMSLPDAATLAKIMAAHLTGLSPCDLEQAAQAARGSSGADVERWAREARRAARVARRTVELADLLVAISPASDPLPEAALRRLAFHEAGHCVVAALLHPGSIRMVSIRRGSAGEASLGGVEFSPPQRGQDTSADVDGLLVRLLAGRAAETLACGVCGGGSGGPANSDLGQATVIAATAEMAWGMGERLSWLGDPDAATLPHMLALHRDVAARVEGRLTDALASATDLLTAHRAGLNALAVALLDRETLTGQDAEKIVRSAI